ncbi:hypothetical protein CLAFUW4_08010 [Fulvia fulva]|uniref:Uncharacterized protein n=1 Tax=Passalora fulva TaxID=5499 RepID=A0A9Q8LCR6_PASFU|nr:uncharacterized protein CLAFUR5_08132 [Fulvia fulva]KAK4629129.1 hypothetical protein CLAFUR4_08015 [Fulvia fulva]KAK4630568.1 hypothetical protein CLAFUR0_08011 [Fulvia fulva]UJO15012.1 hypothetical protein CLAFUR5_08132 [Fulvia fulva]WPV12980.1 hypothetical protein CLAFUW4_08010 [Fulvia fulva]WPV27093.1 hypothetical protein CLAFUW7_08010 [Fulvia fulva]
MNSSSNSGNASSVKAQDGKDHATSNGNSNTNVNGSSLDQKNSYSLDRFLGSHSRKDDPSPWLRKT